MKLFTFIPLAYYARGTNVNSFFTKFDLPVSHFRLLYQDITMPQELILLIALVIKPNVNTNK